MKGTRIASAALLFLTVGGSAMAQAQGKDKKTDKPAPERKAEHQPREARPAPTPKAEHQQHAARQQQHVVQQQHYHAAQQQQHVAQQQQHVAQQQQHVAQHQQRVVQQQQRAAQYRQHLDHQVHVVQQQTARLQQQNRRAQYRVQQEYEARLLLQQQQLRAARDYSRDPYSSPYTYRYVVSGYPRETNQYGADVLRRAANYGYQEGVRSGQADRQDNWAPNYRNSIAYQDANYGYNGDYVSQSDYAYYFRQGFRRGYDDGYNSRSQYGTSSNGTYSMLGNLLSSLLGLQPLR